MMFYTGDRFPGWKGSLFVGGLTGQALVRLTLNGDKVIGEVTADRRGEWVLVPAQPMSPGDRLLSLEASDAKAGAPVRSGGGLNHGPSLPTTSSGSPRSVTVSQEFFSTRRPTRDSRRRIIATSR